MLKARIITALVLLFGLLGALFLLPASGWLVFCALVCAAAGWEWGGLAAFTPGVRRVFAVGAGLACAALGYFAGLGGGGAAAPWGLLPFYALSALFWLSAIPFWLARKWTLHGATAHGAGRGIVVGLVVLVPPALALAHLREIGPWVLLGILAMVWVADIAAYFSGRAFGRRKLAPGISPGKTWEGAYGAAAGVVVFGLVVLAGWAPQAPTPVGWIGAVLVLLGFTAISIVGDLFESLLKRQAGLKDSGTLLPGHGGILDRIDSLTSTLPLAGLAALWLAR